MLIITGEIDCVFLIGLLVINNHIGQVYLRLASKDTHKHSKRKKKEYIFKLFGAPKSAAPPSLTHLTSF